MAVGGRPDQPGHLVLGTDRLGEQDAALGRGQLPRRPELDGGQGGQLGRVDPGLGAGGPVVAAEGGLGGAAAGDPLAAGPAHQPRGGDRAGQGGAGGDQGRGERPGAGVGRDAGGRVGQGRRSGQPGPGAGVQGHALAGGQAVDGRGQVAGLGLGDPAGPVGPGRALHAAGPLEPVGGDHVHLGPGDRDRPGRPHRVPGQPPVRGDPGQPVGDPVAVAAADGAGRVADAQAGLLGGAGRLDLGGGAGRGDLDRVGRVEAGHVPEDAVAPPAAEVVVEHLDDAGRPAALDPGPGPQPGDPLGPAGRRRGERGHPDQQRGPHQQGRVDAPAGSDPHGLDASTR